VYLRQTLKFAFKSVRDVLKILNLDVSS